jgi:hypothetical protein
MLPIIPWLSSLIISWTIAYFIVAKKNGHVTLFEKNLGFCLVTSILLFLIAFFLLINYSYSPDPPYLVPVLFTPICVPTLWSFIVIIYSRQLKNITTLDDVLDD